MKYLVIGDYNGANLAPFEKVFSKADGVVSLGNFGSASTIRQFTEMTKAFDPDKIVSVAGGYDHAILHAHFDQEILLQTGHTKISDLRDRVLADRKAKTFLDDLVHPSSLVPEWGTRAKGALSRFFGGEDTRPINTTGKVWLPDQSPLPSKNPDSKPVYRLFMQVAHGGLAGRLPKDYRPLRKKSGEERLWYTFSGDENYMRNIERLDRRSNTLIRGNYAARYFVKGPGKQERNQPTRSTRLVIDPRNKYVFSPGLAVCGDYAILSVQSGKDPVVTFRNVYAP